MARVGKLVGGKLSTSTLLTLSILVGYVVGDYEIDYGSAEMKMVHTDKGHVRGFTMPLINSSSEHFQAFVGIPYAKPPVGNLRWRPPEDIEPWDESLVYNATHYRPSCMQILDNIRDWSLGAQYNSTSEDCLYLNVFNVNDTSAGGALKPVMVWIHGGSYRYGSGEEYDSRILAQQGVVVVTINYRLGLFGFLSTDDASALGNYGMLDMVAALHWVQRNIAHFGGDNKSVTIFGNSAGGAAVSLLMFSPLTEGLFHRVIAQSGNAMSRWAIYRPPDKNLPCANALATSVNCNTDTSTAAMVECLRSRDAQVLVDATVTGCARPYIANWAPRIDHYFIHDDPDILLVNKSFHPVDYLGGTVPDEVSDEYTKTVDIEIGFSRANKEERMFTWSRRYDDYADVMHAAVMHEYDLPGNNTAEQRDLFLEMRTDYEYNAPQDTHSLGHSAVVNKTYLYSFEYRSINHPTPSWMGVPHFEECFYIFGVPFWATVENSQCPWGCTNVVWQKDRPWDEHDKEMGTRMMVSWIHFAATGVPLTNGGSTAFPRFGADEQQYVAINNNWTTGHYHKYSRIQFWNRFTASLLDTSFGSCTDHVTADQVTACPSVNGVGRMLPSVVVFLVTMITVVGLA